MKTILRHTIFWIVVAAFVVVTALLVQIASERNRETTCTELQTNIRDSLGFVTEAQIKESLDNFYGQYIGERLADVNLTKIEKIISSKGAVKGCQAWTTNDGVLHLDITQRRPVLRLQNGDSGFYADETGYIFPLDARYTAPVPVVEGNIPAAAREPGNRWLKDILSMMAYIKKSRTWSEQIQKVTVRSNGDLVIFPSEGQERFILGAPSDFVEKFARIEKYYSTIRPEMPENYYKTVNVKYSGQIICRKDI